jgi:hypothetical protein
MHICTCHAHAMHNMPCAPLVAMTWSMYFRPEAVVTVSPVTVTGGDRPSRAALTISLPSTACVGWVSVRACVRVRVWCSRSVRSSGREQSACRHRPHDGHGKPLRGALCGALCRALWSHAMHRKQPHDGQATNEAEAPGDEAGRGHDRVELVEARAAAFLLVAAGQLGHIVLGRCRRWRGRRLLWSGRGICGRLLIHEQLALLAAEQRAAPANGGDACPRLGSRSTEEQDGGDRPHERAGEQSPGGAAAVSLISLRLAGEIDKG